MIHLASKLTNFYKIYFWIIFFGGGSKSSQVLFFGEGDGSTSEHHKKAPNVDKWVSHFKPGVRYPTPMHLHSGVGGEKTSARQSSQQSDKIPLVKAKIYFFAQ